MSNKTQILIVDDDALNVEVIDAFLQREGYSIAAVPSGESALEQVQAQPPDVVLMDVRMGGMSGYETTAALKANPATQHIPVLMITGFNEREDIRQALAAGVDDIVFKPIDLNLLLLRVRTLSRLKALHDQLNG